MFTINGMEGGGVAGGFSEVRVKFPIHTRDTKLANLYILYSVGINLNSLKIKLFFSF